MDLIENVSAISLIAITLMLLLVLVLFLHLRALKAEVKLLHSNFASSEMLINQLQSLFVTLEKSTEIHREEGLSKSIELEQVTKQLEHRIKSLREQQLVFEKLQNQQPEDKLYSRAFKLVELGAPIEELMKECEIPRAEAEMLIAIHKKQNK